jgi:hypothetical protein
MMHEMPISKTRTKVMIKQGHSIGTISKKKRKDDALKQMRIKRR